MTIKETGKNHPTPKLKPKFAGEICLACVQEIRFKKHLAVIPKQENRINF